MAGMRALVTFGVLLAMLVAPAALMAADEPPAEPAVEEPAEAEPQADPAADAAPVATTTAAKKKPGASAAADGSVSIQDFFFSPASVTVGVGDSVTWTNNGQETHNASGNGISTGNLDSGESGSATFSSAGSFSYICSIHPQMNGTVRVLASAGSGDVESGGDPDDLPATGAEVMLQALLGAAFGLAGLALRRRAARP